MFSFPLTDEQHIQICRRLNGGGAPERDGQSLDQTCCNSYSKSQTASASVAHVTEPSPHTMSENADLEIKAGWVLPIHPDQRPPSKTIPSSSIITKSSTFSLPRPSVTSIPRNCYGPYVQHCQARLNKRPYAHRHDSLARSHRRPPASQAAA